MRALMVGTHTPADCRSASFTFVVQLEFAGLKDTEATFHDKMRLMGQIRTHYGLPWSAPAAAAATSAAAAAEPPGRKEE
jgi:hypothetical protein